LPRCERPYLRTRGGASDQLAKVSAAALARVAGRAYGSSDRAVGGAAHGR